MIHSCTCTDTVQDEWHGLHKRVHTVSADFKKITCTVCGVTKTTAVVKPQKKEEKEEKGKKGKKGKGK